MVTHRRNERNKVGNLQPHPQRHEGANDGRTLLDSAADSLFDFFLVSVKSMLPEDTPFVRRPGRVGRAHPRTQHLKVGNLLLTQRVTAELKHEGSLSSSLFHQSFAGGEYLDRLLVLPYKAKLDVGRGGSVSHDARNRPRAQTTRPHVIPSAKPHVLPSDVKVIDVMERNKPYWISKELKTSCHYHLFKPHHSRKRLSSFFY